MEYSLTKLGEKFLPLLDALEVFGKDYQNYNKEATERKSYRIFENKLNGVIKVAIAP